MSVAVAGPIWPLGKCGRAKVFGRYEAKTGIRPFSRLVRQVTRDFNPLERRAARRTLRPLLMSLSVSPHRPFSREAGSSRVRTRSVAAHPPDLHRLSLDHASLAVFCPLALFGGASIRFLSIRSQLRFASLTVSSSRCDLHPQECARAGRTENGPMKGAVPATRIMLLP